MRVRGAPLALLLLAACAAAQEAPAPVAPPTVSPAAPEAPAAPALKTSPEALALIEKAAKAQGTWDLRGEKAVKRIRIGFKDMKIHDPKYSGQPEVTLRLALPGDGVPGGRFHCATTIGGDTTILGHTGRVAWTWAGGRLRQLTDPQQDRNDLREVDERRRMLRMALGTFLLGNLVEGPAVVLGPDEEVAIPLGSGSEPRKVTCRRLDREADPAAGEPPLRLYLDAKTLLPVAAHLPAARPDEPSFLLTLDFDPQLAKPDPVPRDMIVPRWVELFEIPPGKAPEPQIRIQARVASVAIDPPTAIPDAEFDPPPAK